MVDYQAADEALDDELRAMYAQAPESNESIEDSLEDSGTASQEQTAGQEPDNDEGTQASDVNNETGQSEPTVPESRYHNAVVAMNRAQQELAERRKQDAEKDSIIQQLQERVQQLEQNQSQQPSNTENVSEDELSEAKELYPEVFNPLMKKIAALEKQLSLMGEDVGTVKNVADRYQKNEQVTAEQQYWNAIKDKHPDVDTIGESPEYADWFSRQSPMIQQAVQSPNAHDVISALDLYRAANPAVHEEKDSKTVVNNDAAKADKLAAAKEAAVPNIKSGGKPEQKHTFTTAEIAKMSRDEFAKHEAAIDEALARGEVA